MLAESSSTFGTCSQRHVLVDEDGDEEGVDRAHRRGLGGREDAAVDAADHDDDQQQPPDAFAEGAQPLRPRAPSAGAGSRSCAPGTRSSCPASSRARRPGSTPAMKSWPTDVLVATAYITITIEGGIRMPERARGGDHAGAEALGKALLHHRRQDDRADGDHGRRATSRRPRRRARRPSRRRAPSPPCQWPTIAVAKLIMRRATPPWVRKLPARMKNGIAMISKLLDAGEQLQRHRRRSARRSCGTGR